MSYVSPKGYRQPTVSEAVENLLRPMNSPVFQKHCISVYRERYGDTFANEVRSKALAKLGKPIKDKK